MNPKTITRLALFFIAVPSIMALIVLLPAWHHLALNVVAIGASVIGSLELNTLLRRHDMAFSGVEAVLAGMLLPAAALVDLFSGPEASVATIVALWLGVSYILMKPIFRTDHFAGILPTMSGQLLLLIYPGFFLAFFVRLSGFADATVLTVVFLLLVFGNDSLAYVFGKMFGRKRGIIPISPNKSIAGFLGGFLTSVGLALAAFFVFPDVFGKSIWGTLAAGAVVGVSTIVGDLVESAMKRGADAKDSGTIIPGRGGILDSIDSILFSAPFYFFICRMFFA